MSKENNAVQNVDTENSVIPKKVANLASPVTASESLRDNLNAFRANVIGQELTLAEMASAFNTVEQQLNAKDKTLSDLANEVANERDRADLFLKRCNRIQAELYSQENHDDQIKSTEEVTADLKAQIVNLVSENLALMEKTKEITESGKEAAWNASKKYAKCVHSCKSLKRSLKKAKNVAEDVLERSLAEVEMNADAQLAHARIEISQLKAKVCKEADKTTELENKIAYLNDLFKAAHNAVVK